MSLYDKYIILIGYRFNFKYMYKYTYIYPHMLYINNNITDMKIEN